MKTHLLRMRAENRDIFEAIESGKKKLETRAGTDKYIKIRAGDMLKFVCGKNSFMRNVTKVKRYKTITAILKDYMPQEINPNTKTKDETIDMYYSFPNYREKIKKHGLIALELK